MFGGPAAAQVTAALTACAIVAVAVASGCGSSGPAAGRGAAAQRDGEAPAICSRLHSTTAGRVDDPAATELSGLARGSAGVLWTHGDSGSSPLLLGLREDGRVLARVAIDGAQAVDWEDIAWARSDAGQPLLFVGDIGDNQSVRDSIDVYRVREPVPADGATAARAQRLRLRYPDGPHDAEALLVSPDGSELAIVTKAARGARAYGARVPDEPGDVLLRRGPSVALALATGGSVSADGRVVAVRGYLSVVAWARRPGESLLRVFARAPCASPTPVLDGQGEAIALDRDGGGFVTVPEGVRPALRRWTPAS